MADFFDNFSKKQKKILGASGITAIAASWTLVIFAPSFGYSSIDAGFQLTIFYVIIWALIKIYKKYL